MPEIVKPYIEGPIASISLILVYESPHRKCWPAVQVGEELDFHFSASKQQMTW